MPVLLGVLAAVVTILVLLKQLADHGISLGGLNPFLWRRRRNWSRQFGAGRLDARDDGAHRGYGRRAVRTPARADRGGALEAQPDAAGQGDLGMMEKGKPAESPAAFVAALDGWRLKLVRSLCRGVRGVAKFDEAIKWGNLAFFANGPAVIIRAKEPSSHEASHGHRVIGPA